MKENPFDVSNDFLLEEIRLNRTEIGKVRDALSNKVGRGELFGWLTLAATVLTTTLIFTGG